MLVTVKLLTSLCTLASLASLYATTLLLFKPDTVHTWKRKVNIRDQNLRWLQSQCDGNSESKVVFFRGFCLFGLFGGGFFETLQSEDEVLQGKGLSIDCGRFHSCVLVYFILS